MGYGCADDGDKWWWRTFEVGIGTVAYQRMSLFDEDGAVWWASGCRYSMRPWGAYLAVASSPLQTPVDLAVSPSLSRTARSDNNSDGYNHPYARVRVSYHCPS